MNQPQQPLTVPGLCDLFEVNFTDEQLAAITAPHAPSVVIAGAGSGKTTLMSARVVWLVASGEVAPDAVLGLTFTNKAAAELSHRVRASLRRLEQRRPSTGLLDDGEPTVSTYHSYAAALVREYGVWGGYEPAAQLITDAQRVQVAETVARSAPGPFPHLDIKLITLTKRLLTLDAELNEHLVDVESLMQHDRALVAELDAVELADGKLTAEPAKARTTAAGRLELAPLVAEFRSRKRHLEQVDFGDQMAAAALLAESIPDVAVGERGRFATVLLDEYQDTSMAQQRLLVALFDSGHPVMAVGDPFQSIYGWRGASVRNILSFAGDFGDLDPTPVFPLGQNNRSGEAILDAANVVARSLREDFPEVGELRPRPEFEGAGELEVALYESAADEVDAMCDAIATEINEGRAPNEIAVLCREGKAFPPIIEALTERGVVVEVAGLSGLLELPEVVEVTAVLEVLHDPTANPKLVRLLTGPRWRIGPADLARLGSQARRLAAPAEASTPANGGASSLQAQLQAAVAGSDPVESVSLIEALENPGPAAFTSAARERFAELSNELRELRIVLHQPPDVAIATVIGRTGLDVELAVQGRTGEYLDALLEHARAFSSVGVRPGVGPFLAYLALAQRYGSTLGGPPATGGGGVTLLTVHKAKGLEWQSVYVPHVVDGVFPNGQGRSTPHSSPGVLPYSLRGDAADFPLVTTWSGNRGMAAFKHSIADRELAEDRRLAYVALTRAADRLVVSGHRWGRSQVKPRDVSPYLQELADLCKSGGGTIRCWAPEPPDDASNPALAERPSFPWPPRGDASAAAARQLAADLVRAAMQRPPGATSSEAGLTEVEQSVVATWDDNIAALMAEAQRQQQPDDSLPAALSATHAVSALRDASAVARELRRPMPRKPAVAAQRGTRFHSWVESLFGQVPLIDVEELIPRGSTEDDSDLATLQQSFMAGPYAERRPIAVEALFHMLLGPQAVTGRIDAVYDADPADQSLPEGTRYEVVDWKTGHHEADQLQLALYRIAWAELHGIPVDAVAATFYYVSSGRVVRPLNLPDRAALTARWYEATA